ncbi:dynamin family protein [Paenibacillus sp. N1-5-1-14]|uniref:dynamin family protein n=1 Tax=Paenibacillus radicibacter TaxID=2972488 RepID=UPI0021593EF2|nr:dynamin family protein [Paenibacillus radicibacter]MCR8641687.1 dynamin family protein [Paenibacillus radicibacter]
MSQTELELQSREINPANIDPMSVKLEKLIKQMELKGDTQQQIKFIGLLEKWRKQRSYIAFCGHFSAGKSTIINSLCGHVLLPSSPIPTSANIVSIANGPAIASVYQQADSGEVLSSKEVPLEELEQYCIDGKAVQRVEITYPLPMLGEHTALLDTPGIDSTDDAHQMATESALYLADVVFYVMDYNHVLSEMNLAFAKKMAERGKPLYLIVNMIDKHRDAELSFESYKEGVIASFRSWGIEPSGVLYVSMKVRDHRHNEWGQLRYLLAELIARAGELRAYSVDQAARQLLVEHDDWQAQVHAPRKAELREALGDDGAQLIARREELLRGAAAAKEEPQRVLAALRKDLVGIIDNANIIPAVTRDTAHEYLQSRKSGFKAGFFARAAQTEAEIQRRLDKLHAEFKAGVTTQLERHIQTMLREAYETSGIEQQTLLSEATALHVDITTSWLADQVKTGAVFTGEYTLNYMKDVASEVKSQYRRLGSDLAERMANEMEHAASSREPELTAQIAELDESLMAYHELSSLEQSEQQASVKLQHIVNEERVTVPTLPDMKRYVPDVSDQGPTLGLKQASMDVILRAAHTFREEQGGEGSAQSGTLQSNESQTVGSIITPSAAFGTELTNEAETRAKQFHQAAQIMEEVPALRSIARSLSDKASRILDRTFTVALFGAFSAGKSSFANALIGERVLPVSPNPTTAAINRILPPQEGWAHGTARVKMKSLDALESDVLYSLQVLGLQAQEMNSALQAIATLTPDKATAKGKPHYSFLTAVQRGWVDAKDHLGQELVVNQEQFAAYVAEEAKSCFVDGIELFYANPLTDQGVVIVDTPGADSINARHTGVAFNYIKNADAILFVTYYNHAFSHADKEFLLQLGRVKDAFQLDKMFFIVNAADLASSEDELDGVIRHVETNLLSHGIRFPRIYPISSQWAAEGKLNQDPNLVAASGITSFEKDFASFTFRELTQLAVSSAEAELKRGLHTMDRWISGAKEGENTRLTRIEQLRASNLKANELLQVCDETGYSRDLSQEIEDLLFYVKQRTTYRYGELFAQAFNPSVFRDQTHSQKDMLQAAWNDFKRMIAFQLEQEVLATTLRIEKKVNELGGKQYAAWGTSASNLIEGFEYEAYPNQTYTTPQIAIQLEVAGVDVKMLQGFFKNAKYFFEGEGRDKLKVALETPILDGLTAVMNAQSDKFKQLYNNHLSDVLSAMKSRQLDAIADHIEGSVSALELKVDLDDLYKKREEVFRLL